MVLMAKKSAGTSVTLTELVVSGTTYSLLGKLAASNDDLSFRLKDGSIF